MWVKGIKGVLNSSVPLDHKRARFRVTHFLVTLMSASLSPTTRIWDPYKESLSMRDNFLVRSFDLEMLSNFEWNDFQFKGEKN